MASWLAEEEQPFGASLLPRPASRSKRSARTYSFMLRALRVLNNGRLFGSSDVVVQSVIVDGYPDMKSGLPFWVQNWAFAAVRDGASLAIDPVNGILLYRGQPRDFANLHVIVVRDTRASAELAKVLKDSFLAEGIGMVAAGAAGASIFAGLPPTVTVEVARDLAKKAVDTTLDHFAKRKEKVIGTYYGSLVRETEYGLGTHPANYPASLITCGGALEIAYQVERS